MVAVVCPWHIHHSRATQEIDRRLTQGEEMIIAAHAVVEAYAVLTRLPSPYRLAPADAFLLLETNFMGTKLVALDGKSYRSLLSHAPIDGIAGGRIYDAVIGACALQAKVTTLLTFNDRHFSVFLEKGITVVVP
jgi:predicted nucleic acid-binding protein